MNETLDLIAVLVLVALAFGFLLRRQLRRRKAPAGTKACSSCGSCNRCG